MVMQICEEVALKHDLVCLLQEKPSLASTVWAAQQRSISTLCGTQLLNPGDLTRSLETPALPIVMSAIVAGIDTYGDLMRLAIASPVTTSARCHGGSPCHLHLSWYSDDRVSHRIYERERV